MEQAHPGTIDPTRPAAGDETQTRKRKQGQISEAKWEKKSVGGKSRGDGWDLPESHPTPFISFRTDCTPSNARVSDWRDPTPISPINLPR